MDELIEQHSALIKSIAKKFYNVEKEDLYQAGCLGLIKAYNNYTDKNIKFSSYAYKYIFGEMYDLSIRSKNIKMNKEYIKLYKSIMKAKNYLTLELGREVSDYEVAEYLEEDLSLIEYIITITDSMLSFDDPSYEIQVGKYDINDEKILLYDSIDKLDNLSSRVIKYRYLFDLTQNEVSKILGISQVKVSRIESKGKNKIKELIK